MNQPTKRLVDETSIEQFESAIIKGDSISIEDFLPPKTAANYVGTLFELVQIDQEFNWKATGVAEIGDATLANAPLVETYLQRFPVLKDETLLKQLIQHEYYLRQRYALKPQLAEYRKRFPDIIISNEDLPEAVGEMAAVGDIRPGAMIGPYKLLQEIGSGGFGVVYLAEQKEPVRRRVALKVIKAGMDTREVINRFEAERQALAMMDHPNIASVLDAGATDSGRPYFVMQLVKGVPITEYCNANKLSIRQRLGLFIQVCQAIHHAHQKGIIHRDIKPSNVLVGDNEGEPAPKVIDFGIAKATQSSLTAATMFTRTGQVIGTPQYMSPEQADAKQQDIDTRSDIYSLGVVLYELFVGSTPIELERLRAAGYQEMLRMVREAEAPNPSSRLSESGDAVQTISDQRKIDSYHLRRTLNGELDWIVMKALEKDRTRRYESASAFAADLERYLNLEPVEAGPPSAIYKLRKLAGKYWQVAGSVAAFVLLLIVGVAVSTWFAVAENRQRGLATAAQSTAEAAEKKTAQALIKVRDAKAVTEKSLAETQQAKTAAETALATSEKERQRSQAVTDFLVTAFRAPDKSSDGRKVTMVQVLENAVRKMRNRFKNEPLVRATLLAAIARTYHNLGLYSEAAALANESFELNKTHLGVDHRDTVAMANELMLNQIPLDDFGEIIAAREQAYNKIKDKRGPKHRATLRSLADLAYVHSVARDKKALPLYEELVALCGEVLPKNNRQTLDAKFELGDAYLDQAKTAKAIEQLKPVFTAYKSAMGADNKRTLEVMAKLAQAYRAAGDYEKSLVLATEGLKVARSSYDDDDAITQTMMNNLFHAYRASKQYDAAFELQKEVYQLRRNRLGENDLMTLSALTNLTYAAQRAKDNNAALKCAEEAYWRYKTNYGVANSRTESARETLFECYLKLEQPGRAIGLFDDFVNHQTLIFGEQSLEAFDAIDMLAEALIEIGDTQQAVELYEQLVAATSKKFGPKHAETQHAMNNLAVAYHKADRPLDSIALHYQALRLRQEELGEDHNDTIVSLNNLAYVYRSIGNPSAAIPLYRKAWELKSKSLGETHERTLVAASRLARALEAAGDWQAALPLREEVLKQRKLLFGANHQDTIEATTRLAFARLHQDDFDRAANLYRAANDADNTEPWLAYCLFQLGEIETAETELVKIETREDLDSNSLSGILVANIRGRIALQQRDFKTAKPLLIDSYEQLVKQSNELDPQQWFVVPDSLNQVITLFEATQNEAAAQAWRAKFHGTLFDEPPVVEN